MPKPTTVTEALADDTGASATDNYTSDDTLTGSAPHHSTITFALSNGLQLGQTTASGPGTYTFKPTLPDGTYTVIASDQGHSASVTFTLDTAPPAVTETFNGATTPRLAGTGDPNATVTLTEGATTLGTATADPSGAWNFGVSQLSAGQHTVTASETDLAGNTGSASTTFTLQSGGGTGGGGTGGVPAYSHIVLVVEENHDYSQIIGNTAQAPYINSLAADGALLTNYDAITHPSEPNYFALYAGSTFGVTDDNYHSESDPTLATVLKSAQPSLSFLGYEEGLNDGSYDPNHTPWYYFQEGNSVAQDFSTSPFATGNYSSLPSISFVTPSLNDDMHDGTIAQGDTWLSNNINSYAQWAKDNNSLLMVTWDENDGTGDGNHVATILYGAHVNAGAYGTAYNHYDTLSTMLSSFGLTGPNNSATAAPFSGMWG